LTMGLLAAAIGALYSVYATYDWRVGSRLPT
jgi:hypothetical protein